jgi:hypothetical protein
MFILLAAQIFIQAFLLCLLLYAFAKHEADYSFPKVAMVSAVCMVGTLLISGLVGEKLGPFTILLEIGFIAFMLMTFCWISLAKSVLVVIIFCLIHVLFSLGVTAIKVKMFGPDDGLTPEERAEQKVNRLEQEMLKTMGIWPEGEHGGSPAPKPSGRKTAVVGQEDVPAPHVQGLTTPPPGRTDAPSYLSSSVPSKAVKVTRPAARGTRREWEEARRQLDISSTMSGAGGKRLAVINGRIYHEQDIVSINCAGKVFRWKIRTIRGNGVDLDPL